jgi:hypothetical protein
VKTPLNETKALLPVEFVPETILSVTLSPTKKSASLSVCWHREPGMVVAQLPVGYNATG